MTEQDLLSILGENAQSKNLTAKKTNEIMQRDKSVITGFVVTDAYGNVAIVDKSAVRWMSKDQLWQFFHSDQQINNMTEQLNNAMCERCGENDACEPHICPYAEDIHGDYETLCTCCEKCERECCMDI